MTDRRRSPLTGLRGSSPADFGSLSSLSSLSAEQIASAVRSRALRAVDVVAVALARIRRVEPTLCAFAEVWEEEALRRARAVDERVGAGEAPPLAGVPIGVKGRHGLRTAGPLLAAGCVAVGATAVPGPGTPWQTWGLGAYGRTVNPWRADRTPGGSSAGSAAAVAAGLVPLATGSDGAGSVRIPAAWCGVLGLKVTNGRLPTADRTGLTAPGVLVRTASDAAAYWRVMTGGADDPRVCPTPTDTPPATDTPRSTDTPPATDTRPATGTPPPAQPPGSVPPSPPAPGRHPPATALWSPDLGFADPDPDIVAIAHAAAVRLAGRGTVRLLPTRVPHFRLEDPAPAWLALRTPGADPAVAHRVRTGNDLRLDALFAGADLLLTPTTPSPPHGHEGPGERYSTALTWAFNLSGHPAISVPAGFGADGCPVGLQLVAARGREELLLRTLDGTAVDCAP